MREDSIAAAVVVTIISSLALGCLKMESDMTVHPDGSATGFAIIGVQEAYFNMSDWANFTTFDYQNATIWTEEGWVYIKTNETRVGSEDLSIDVTRYPEYTEYTLQANLSGLDQALGEEDYLNLSDPFTQLLLQTMTFKFRVTMPGSIVESNAGAWSGSDATWSYNGVTIQSAEGLYVRSRLSVDEGPLPLIGIPLVVLAGLLGRQIRAD